MPDLATFANPYLACDTCSQWVTGARGLNTDGPAVNVPCGHTSGATSRCHSWGAIDGCTCQEHLGHVPHDEPEGER